MRVPLGEARFQVADTASGLRVVIPARRRILVLIFFCAWLVGWGFGEESAATQVADGHAGGQTIFLLAWLVAWTVGGGVVIVMILWMMVGKETIASDADSLTVRRSVGPLGRTREYQLSEVRGLRVAPQPYDLASPAASYRWLGLVGGPVAFDYGQRTYRLGGSLDEAEAEALTTKLQQQLPPRHSYPDSRSSVRPHSN